ncbi:sulfatase-like hydrolase/transferase [Olleya sp. ITB9]|uniref:sulfatase-like hydrolase/transferase n=1 Tax=Olleya sp. ITB9 TaxID=1715648 RepID=UPI0006D2B639|nr:sulfatase-like hydrolase/transferase [Olleya sp. ITB9]
MKKRILKFVNSEADYPVITGLASGLYPMFYYYNSNFTQVNSFYQFFFFLLVYLVIPVIVMLSISFLLTKITFLKTYKKQLYLGVNISWFGYLLMISTIGISAKYLFFIAFLSIICAIAFYNFFKKIVVFQLLLGLLSSVMLVPILFRHFSYSNQWLDQPDAIKNVIFKTKPNIYMIQVDGYVNVEVLDKGYYDFDNSNFNNYLKTNGFKNYKNYRSNYFSTLSSNSSLFAMKHHYYSEPVKAFNELINARQVIVTDNPVLQIFKKNNYKTHLLLEHPYFLVNRPKMGYDYCNINPSEIAYNDKGFSVKKEVLKDLQQVLSQELVSPSFYFIEKLLPSHITNMSADWANKKSERIAYLNRLEETNLWLKNAIEIIENKDKNALIIISADHGGFVGFNNTKESATKMEDKGLIYSIYSAMLSIKWNDQSPDFDYKFKTPVNFFRILFSHLSQDKKYLNSLEEDSSYIIIDKGAPFGVYKYIDAKGNTVFNPLSN